MLKLGLGLQESRLIAQAGVPGCITVATSMAGRGTDIILGGNPKGLVALELDHLLLPHIVRGEPCFCTLSPQHTPPSLCWGGVMQVQ